MASQTQSHPAALYAPISEQQRAATETLSQYADRLALRCALGAGVLALVLVLVLNWGDRAVPLLRDRQGFGMLTLYLAPASVALSTAATYVLGLRAYNRRVDAQHRRRWQIAALPVAFGYALLTAFLVALALQIAELAFAGLELAALQAASITAVTTGAMTQMFARNAARMDSKRMLLLVVTSLAAGVYATASLVDNPEWWRISFSYLGSLESNAHRVFNVTLAFGGLLILAWLPYVLSDVRVLIEHGIARPIAYRYFQIGLIWLAVGIALVGIFKTQATPFSSLVHNLAAYSLAGAFGVLFVFFRRVLPGASREVLTLTWVLVAGLAATLAMAAVGYFNTVGLEIICFVIGLTWLQSITSFVHSEAVRLDPARNPE